MSKDCHVLSVLTFVVIGSLAFSDTCWARPCETLENASDQRFRDYLRHRKPDMPGDCVAAALDAIGPLGIGDDSQIFVQYLDFAPPDRQGMFVVDKDNAVDLFPAIRGLVRIGNDAVPQLLKVIENADESYAVRRNAVRTIRLICGADSAAAIKVVLTAAVKQSGARRSSLLKATAWLSSWCTDRERPACDTAY